MLRWLLSKLGRSAPVAAEWSKPTYRPYPKNVPGPVYVGDGCCMSCGIWELDAPQHFAWDDYPDGGGHCYVKRQPETDEEFANVLEAIRSQELDCIRVKTRNDRWRAMMADPELGEYLDD